MSISKPYAFPYVLFLGLISFGTIYIFFTSDLSTKEEIHPALVAYLVIKGFLVFANITRPFKNFNYNPIVFKTLINLGIGVILAFLYLQIYTNPILSLTDCGLCLITVFSLLKMHQKRNEEPNYIQRN